MIIGGYNKKEKVPAKIARTTSFEFKQIKHAKKTIYETKKGIAYQSPGKFALFTINRRRVIGITEDTLPKPKDLKSKKEKRHINIDEKIERYTIAVSGVALNIKNNSEIKEK